MGQEQEIIEKLSVPEGQEPIIDLVVDPQNQPPAEPPATPDPPAFVLNPLWDVVKSKISTEDNPYELPEEIRSGKFGEGKTEHDALIEFIQQNTDFSSLIPEDDDFIASYREAKSGENFELSKFIEGLNLPNKNLTGGDYIRDYYTKNHLKTDANPNGYSPEDIESYISSKSRIELDKEANALMEMEQTRLNKKNIENQNRIKQEELEAFNRAEETNLSLINQYVEANKLSTEFYGVQFSEAERAAFLNDLPGMFKRDPTTRKNKMEEYLKSNEAMLELAALVWMSKNGVKGSISRKVENVKKELEGRLSNERQPEGNIVVPGVIDLAALAQPEE